MKKKRNASPMRKLIPAAGMLAVSAMMLASSTYAWFTMNKEVEVKGLQMQATTSSGLEISLGAWGTAQDTNAISLNSPTKNDISWKRNILVSDYYATVGKILPASSDDALDVYTVPAAKVYAGGHRVEDTATISSATEDDSATMTLQTYGNGTNAIQTVDTAGTEGYYIDIPMWIRSSNRDTTNNTPVYATVTITDPDSTNGADLIKAVRVAIIPTGQASSESTMAISKASASYTAGSTTASTVTPLNAAPNASAAASIFGLEAKNATAAMDSATAESWPTYHSKVIKATGIYNSTASSTTMGTTSINAARGAAATQVTATQVFTIPSATADDYGRVGFVARIWLEGESIYCEDATANQDWNIDFYFSTDNSQQDAWTAPAAPTTPDPGNG